MRSLITVLALLLAATACAAPPPAVVQPTATPPPATPTPSLTPTVTPAPRLPASLADVIDVAKDAIVLVEQGAAQGSGFFVDDRGMIVTNQHVVGDERYVVVTVHDGRLFTGQVVLADKSRDLAVVQLFGAEQARAPALPLSSRQVRLAEESVALGYPQNWFFHTASFSSNVTVTRGIISSLRMDQETGTRFIQTDAAISPGNSGGPLMDLDGRVIGVVAAKFVIRGVEGIAFAVDVSHLQDMLVTAAPLAQSVRQSPPPVDY